MLNKLFILLLGIVFSVSSYACSCIWSSTIHNFNQANYVFKGKVIGVTIDQIENNKTLQFLIITSYKNKYESDTISVKTGFGGGDCGLSGPLNSTYLIYTNGEYVNICNGSHMILDADGNKNDYLEMGKTAEEELDSIVSMKDGYIKWWQGDTIIVAEGNFINGRANGYWHYNFDWFANEYPYIIEDEFYINGLKDSVALAYFTNGDVSQEIRYKKGKLHGLNIMYNKDGSFYNRINYVNGKKKEEWDYFKSGQLKRNTICENGGQTYKYIYREDGTLEWKGKVFPYKRISRVHFRKGNEEYDKGNYKDAITNYTLAFETGYTRYAYVKRAHCYYHLGEYKKAIDDYSQTENNQTDYHFDKEYVKNKSDCELKLTELNNIRFCEEMLGKKEFSQLELRLILDSDTIPISKVNLSRYKKPLIPNMIHNDSTLIIIIESKKYSYKIPVRKNIFEYGNYLDICFTGKRSKGSYEYRLDWGSNISALGYLKRTKK